MSMSTAPPKAISKLVSSAPLLLGIAAIVSSIAQWKSSSSSDSKKLTDDINNIRQQVTTLAMTQTELNKNIAMIQISQNEDISRRKVIAELEYSSAIIEARTIRMKFGKDAAEQFLMNRKRIRDEVLKIEQK